jgi:ribonuclease HII
VVGGFLLAESAVPRLTDVGATDSKRLSPRRREEVYESLGRFGTRVSVAVPPARVDAAVRRNRLNRLEAEAFAQLIRRTRPDVVILDACEVNTRRFGQEVADLAGFTGTMDARNHADRDFPLVGAASIVAKVRRDAALARLQRSVGAPLGSGYPADARTVAYLEAAVRPGRPVPPWVRGSWSTTQRVMAARSRRTLEGFGP